MKEHYSSVCFVKNGHCLHRFYPEDIHWISAEGNYITLHTSQKRFVLKMPMKKLWNYLPEQTFSRIHRSYIVHLNAITRIDVGTNEVFIGDNALPLGRSFKKNLLDKIQLWE